MSISTNNTQRAEGQVRAEARRRFKGEYMPNSLRVVFEHGQWWVMFDGKAEGETQTFSVVDTSDGVDFERV